MARNLCACMTIVIVIHDELCNIFCNWVSILSFSLDLTREKRFISASTLIGLGGLATSGASIGMAATQMSRDNSYRVSLNAEIINTLRWPMTHPSTYTEHGEISLNPRLVAPGTKEAVVMRDSHGKRIGSGGTMSWRLQNREIIVMWYVPSHVTAGWLWGNRHVYYHEHNCNELGVGISSVGSTDYNTFDEIHHVTEWAPYVPPLSGRKSRVERWYTNAWTHSDYVHGSFYDHTLYDTDKFRPVKFCDDLVCISGTMGNDKHTTIQITVYPAANMTHLADGLYQEYQKAAEFHG